MKHHISICKLLTCRSTSGLHMGLETRKPLNSAVRLYCRIPTGTGSFKSCIMRTWDKTEGCLIFLYKFQTTGDECNSIMLGGGSVSLQSMARGVYICFEKKQPFFHYHYIVGNEWCTYTCACQVMLCESTSDTVTFMEFCINSYITKYFIIGNL